MIPANDNDLTACRLVRGVCCGESHTGSVVRPTETGAMRRVRRDAIAALGIIRGSRYQYNTDDHDYYAAILGRANYVIERASCCGVDFTCPGAF